MTNITEDIKYIGVNDRVIAPVAYTHLTLTTKRVVKNV